MDKYVVKYGNDMTKYDRHWNCEDSEVEAFRVYDYFKYIYRHISVWKNDKILREYRAYEEETEEYYFVEES